MGVWAKALSPPRAAVISAASSVPGVYSYGGPTASFSATTRAYFTNEIVAAGINLLATSAAEPHIVGKRWRRNKPTTRVTNGYYEAVDEDNPLIHLLNNPNPYMSRGQFWAGMVTAYYLAGNAYAQKARTKVGSLVAELWPIQPDQMKPIPGNMAAGEPFIKGYERSFGGKREFLPAADVLHFKTHNPLNPYEGVSRLLPLLPRVTIDSYMRNFLSTFYERGGAGVGANVNIKNGRLDQQQKDDFRDRFKRLFSGGQYDVLITSAEEFTYTPFSLNRGLRDALPKEIDAVTEARIAMVLGIPGSILGLLIGYETSSYANQRQAWQVLWDVTMTPLLSDFDDVLNLSLVPEPGFKGTVDEVCFDLSDIRALQEDEDKLQQRARENVTARIWTMEEGREKTGMGTANASDHFLLPDGSAVKVSDLESTAPQEPASELASRRGRPRTENDPAARAIYDEAQALYLRHPAMTWEQIASRVGVEARTLRKYRRTFGDDDN